MSVPLFVGMACSDSSADETGATVSGAVDDEESGDGASELRPNWHQDIAPLVAEHCVGCHQSGGIAPFSMETYETSAMWSVLMASNIELELMPPWHAVSTEECTAPHDFVGDARLDDASKQLFFDWDSNGAPEGDPALAVELPEAPDVHLTEVTQTIPMQGSLSIAAVDNTLDFLHCISFDPQLSEDVYLDAFEVLPGNTNIGHHVLVYVDEGAGSANWPDGIQENCGGGTGGVPATLIGGWVPGAMPQIYPEGVGVRIPAGSRLIFNYHFHATGGGAEIDDSSALALRYSSTAPEWIGQFELIGNETNAVSDGAGNMDPPFFIPAGAMDHEETMVWTLPNFGNSEVRLFNIATHAHVVATDLQIMVEPSSGDSTWCPLQTPEWDFAWQRIYLYDIPIEQAPQLYSGDVVKVRCRYNNSLSNSALPPVLAEQGLTEPVDIALGEGTLDEMCLAAFGVAVRAAP